MGIDGIGGLGGPERKRVAPAQEVSKDRKEQQEEQGREDDKNQKRGDAASTVEIHNPDEEVRVFTLGYDARGPKKTIYTKAQLEAEGLEHLWEQGKPVEHK